MKCKALNAIGSTEFNKSTYYIDSIKMILYRFKNIIRELDIDQETCHNSKELDNDQETCHNSKELDNDQETCHNSTELDIDQEASHNSTESDIDQEASHNSKEPDINEGTSHYYYVRMMNALDQLMMPLDTNSIDNNEMNNTNVETDSINSENNEYYDRKTRNNQVTVLPTKLTKIIAAPKILFPITIVNIGAITFIVLLKILKTLYCKKVTNSCYSINRITIA